MHILDFTINLQAHVSVQLQGGLFPCLAILNRFVCECCLHMLSYKEEGMRFGPVLICVFASVFHGLYISSFCHQLGSV